MELFARISYTYPAGDKDIKNDSEVNKLLNDKLTLFIKEKGIQEYRILNGDITSLPQPSFDPGNESVICSINIAYKLSVK
jgi:hypothetical protein